MLTDIRHRDAPVSDALREFAVRRLARVVRPFRDAIHRVDVRFSDVNGPRGGVDTESSVTVELPSLRQPVIVVGKGADAYEAILNACARLHEPISRALGKRSRIDRPGEPPPATAPEEGGTDHGGSEVVVTAPDYARLRALARARMTSRDRDAAEALADELDRAEVVPPERIAGNIVTMNSRIVFRDEDTGESREVSLVYPEDSNPSEGRLSILAPVGTALLGLAVGQTIDWPLPNRQVRRYRLLEILYQPEASGDNAS